MAEDLRPIWPDAPRLDSGFALPPYRFLPGHNERPREDHCGASGFAAGVDLYHAGYLWEAHEVWETLWKESRSDYYQGLIQMAAALIKVHIGQWSGAGRLIARARERLAQTAGADLLEQFDSCFGEGPERVVWESAPRIRT